MALLMFRNYHNPQLLSLERKLFVTNGIYWFGAILIAAAFRIAHFPAWMWIPAAVTMLGIIVAGLYALLSIRLKYPMRWEQSMKFYRANARRFYPRDKWLRFWHVAGRVILG